MNSPTPEKRRHRAIRGRPSAPYRRGIWGRSESDLRREPAEFLVGRRRVVRDPHHVSRSRTPPTREQHGVDVGADEVAAEFDIVARVGDDRNLVGVPHAGRPVEELRRPRAAGEKRDHTRARRRADLYPASAGDGAAQVE